MEQLDLTPLRTFFILAQCGNYTETARRLYRTQSAVSHAIHKLEETVGVPLIARSRGGVKLTEDGRRLYQACETAFGAFDAALETIAHRRGKPLGRLRLGATVEFGCSILMKHMSTFICAHPDILMEFTMSHNLLEPLLRDDLDLIIDCGEHRHPELVYDPLFREVYVVVVAPGFGQAHHLICPEDLAGCPILSLDLAGTWWNHFLFSLPSLQHPVLGRIIPVNHIRAMITAARHGIGVALAPRYSVLSDVQSGRLEILFPDIELQEDRFTLYQKRSRAGLARNRLMTEYLKGIQPAEFGS